MCRSVYSASKMYMRYAVVRFDAFPKYVVSDVLERTILDAPGDILEWEYVVFILSAIVPLGYIIIGYLRWKRWCQ